MLRNDNLEAQMQAIFKYWFIDFEPFKNALTSTPNGSCIPNGWHETTLGNYVVYAQGTQVPVENQYNTPSSDRIRFLRIVDYTGNTNEPSRYININPNNSICEPDDILIIRYGASAGQICRGLYGVFANNLFSITPIKSISKSYLYYFLTQSIIRDYITSVGETSSAMPALTHGLISSIPIVIPNDRQYLNNFETIAAKAFRMQQQNNIEIKIMQEVCNSLLSGLGR